MPPKKKSPAEIARIAALGASRWRKCVPAVEVGGAAAASASVVDKENMQPLGAVEVQHARAGNAKRGRDDDAAAMLGGATSKARAGAGQQCAEDTTKAIAHEIALLRDGAPDAQELAAGALFDLAADRDVDSKLAIVRAGGITPLVALVREGAPDLLVTSLAAGVLWHLAHGNADSTVAIERAGGIAPLVALVRDGGLGAPLFAAGALTEIASHIADGKVAIARAGGIAPLVALVREGTTPEVRGVAACALVHLSIGSADNTDEIVDAGSIAPLVALLREGCPEGRFQAVCLMGNLADVVWPDAIARAGGIAALVTLVREGTEPITRELAAGILVDLADFAGEDSAFAAAVENAAFAEAVVAGGVAASRRRALIFGC
jgi:hypothetical protein